MNVNLSNDENAPVYSGKHMVKGDFLIFSSNKSFLFKNKIMDVSVNLHKKKNSSN